MWFVWLTLSAGLWALHMAALKIAGERLPPVQIVFFFYLFAIPTVLALLVLTRKPVSFAAVTGDHSLLLALAAAGISIALVDYCFVRGLGLGPALSTYAPLFSTMALAISAAIGVFYFGEAVTLTRAAGFVFACIGIFLLTK